MLPEIQTSYLPENLQFRIVPFEGPTEYNSLKLHRHEYLEVFIFNNGGGVHLIDFKEYSIETGDIHFVFPNQIHLVKRSSDAHGFVVLFKVDFLRITALNPIQAFYNTFFDSPVLNTNKEQSTLLSNLFNLLNQEYGDKDASYSTAMLRYYVNAFLIQCLRFKETESKEGFIDENHQVCNAFRKLVEENFKAQQGLDFYQEILGLSYKVLAKVTKLILGKSPKALLDERLNLEIRRELLYSAKSVKEIAYEYSFADPSSLTKFFNRMNQTTPQKFKDLWAKKYKP